MFLSSNLRIAQGSGIVTQKNLWDKQQFQTFHVDRHFLYGVLLRDTGLGTDNLIHNDMLDGRLDPVKSENSLRMFNRTSKIEYGGFLPVRVTTDVLIEELVFLNYITIK